MSIVHVPRFSLQLKCNISNLCAQNALNFVIEIHIFLLNRKLMENLPLTAENSTRLLVVNVNCVYTEYRVYISCDVIQQCIQFESFHCKNASLPTLENSMLPLCMAWLQSNQFHLVAFPKIWIISSDSFVYYNQATTTIAIATTACNLFWPILISYVCLRRTVIVHRRM